MSATPSRIVFDLTLMWSTLHSDNNMYLVVGRCIRQLVSLTDRVEDLVHEADWCACLDDPNVSCGEE